MFWWTHTSSSRLMPFLMEWRYEVLCCLVSWSFYSTFLLISLDGWFNLFSYFFFISLRSCLSMMSNCKQILVNEVLIKPTSFLRELDIWSIGIGPHKISIWWRGCGNLHKVFVGLNVVPHNIIKACWHNNHGIRESFTSGIQWY